MFCLSKETSKELIRAYHIYKVWMVFSFSITKLALISLLALSCLEVKYMRNLDLILETWKTKKIKIS